MFTIIPAQPGYFVTYYSREGEEQGTYPVIAWKILHTQENEALPVTICDDHWTSCSVEFRG